MNTETRRVAVVGGNRIPFARSDSANAHASNQDLLTAALDGLIDRFGLENERLGEVGFSLRDHPPTYPHVPAFPLQMAVMAWASVSTMLRRGRSQVDVAVPPAMRKEMRPQDGDEEQGEGFAALPADHPASAEWRLGGDLGRRYAAVSGDRNPIHMHSLTAKPLGFPGAIAHGMWTKARRMAALETACPTPSPPTSVSASRSRCRGASSSPAPRRAARSPSRVRDAKRRIPTSTA